MRFHYLPPPEKIGQLEPYLLVTTAMIVVMGILGGWAGNAWLLVLGVCLIRFAINIGVYFLRKRGISAGITFFINALVNFVATLLIILLVVWSPNPFWLLFIVETVAAALYRSVQGIVIYSISVFLFLGFIQITQGLDQPSLATGFIYAFLALVIGLTTNRSLVLLYKEQEEREKVEEEVRQSEKRLRRITDNMLDVIVEADEKNNLIYISPSIKSVLGYRVEDLNTRPMLELIHPEDMDRVVQASQAALTLDSPLRLEVRLRHANGQYVWLECIGNPMVTGGRLMGSIISGREITKRKKMEAQVYASLREKEVLLKEIHHRVKNNLQVISSLLNLQSQKIRDPASLSAFRESQNRVRSMALIHEKLYQSENLAEVEFSQYINNLSAYLMRSYRANTVDIKLNIHCDPIYLDIDTSVPCGLILNELISNALKYAFPENSSGEIWIEMRKRENNQVTLAVADNGIGFPTDLDPLSTPSLGLQLVQTLVDQLGGELHIQNNHGMRIEISFQPIHQRQES